MQDEIMKEKMNSVTKMIEKNFRDNYERLRPLLQLPEYNDIMLDGIDLLVNKLNYEYSQKMTRWTQRNIMDFKNLVYLAQRLEALSGIDKRKQQGRTDVGVSFK